MPMPGARHSVEICCADRRTSLIWTITRASQLCDRGKLESRALKSSHCSQSVSLNTSNHLPLTGAKDEWLINYTSVTFSFELSACKSVTWNILLFFHRKWYCLVYNYFRRSLKSNTQLHESSANDEFTMHAGIYLLLNGTPQMLEIT